MPTGRMTSSRGRAAEGEFKRRFLDVFKDDAYGNLTDELSRVVAAAWDAYAHERKSPHTQKAGEEFSDPDYDLSLDWIAAKDAIREAESRHKNADGPSRILLINGSSRSEHTCPGELSKSYRMVELAKAIFEDQPNFVVAVLEPQPGGVRVWPAHSSLQVMLLDVGRPLSLAMLVLPKLFAGPDA